MHRNVLAKASQPCLPEAIDSWRDLRQHDGPLERVFTFTKSLLVTAFLSGACVTAAPPPAWSQFRGPNGSGVADSDQPPPVTFSPETNLLWKTALPLGHSSPCIWGNRIFLTGFHPEAQKLETLCLDRVSGRILWRQAAPAQAIEKIDHAFSPNTPATPTPATDGKVVIVYFGSYGLMAFDFDGTVLWQKALPSTANMHGSGSSPIIVGEIAIMDLHLAPEPRLLALRVADGQALWTRPMLPSGRGWSTPITWQEGGEAIVGLLTPARFGAYRLEDGVEKWWVTGMANETCSTPVVANGQVYFYVTHALGDAETIRPAPSFDTVLGRYDRNKDGSISTDELDDDLMLIERSFTGKGLQVGNFSLKMVLGFANKGKERTYDRAAWEKQSQGLDEWTRSYAVKEPAAYSVRCGGAGDVTSSHMVWTEKKGLPQVASALFYRDRLYFVKNDGLITCREPATGRVIYQERLGAPGGYYASPIAADGKIYTASDRGRITVFKAGDILEVLARNDLNERIVATPAIVEGNLYVRAEGALYAFGEQARK